MSISLFQQIIKSLPRRKIASLVSTHESDKWVKRFSTFDHLMVMIYAQLSARQACGIWKPLSMLVRLGTIIWGPEQ